LLPGAAGRRHRRLARGRPEPHVRVSVWWPVRRVL